MIDQMDSELARKARGSLIGGLSTNRPTSARSLIDTMKGGPAVGNALQTMAAEPPGSTGPTPRLGGSLSQAFQRAMGPSSSSTGPMSAPGLDPGAAPPPPPPPRQTPLSGGGTMTTNDPTVGLFDPERGGAAFDAFGTQVGPPPAADAPPVDQSQWNTEGYARPGYTVSGTSQVPSGAFDQANWNDPNMQTPKYVIGRIASQYKDRLNDPAALREMEAEIQKAYPGVRFDGKDRLSGIPGIAGTVDLIAKAGSPDADLWWNDESEGGGDGTAADGPPGSTGAGPFGFMDPSLAGDPMASIQQALAAVQRPGTIQELIAKLQGGGA